MRILVINYEYPPIGGGGGFVTRDIFEKIAEYGHRVSVITSHFKGLKRQEVVNGVKIFRVPVLMRSKMEVASLPSMLSYFPSSVLETLLNFNGSGYDVINTHFALPSGPTGYVLSKLFGLPNVLTIHGGDIFDPSKSLSPHKTPVLRNVVRFMINHADRVVAQSNNTRTNAQEYYVVERQIDLIPLGIKKPAFSRKIRDDFGLDPEDVVFCTIGRLVKRKNLDDALAILSVIKDRYRFQFLIIGDGPERFHLEGLVSSLGLQKMVRFFGNVTDEVKFQLLDLSDCYLSTASHEGFGLVFLEAMECGVPIICYDSGGQTDFLRDGQTGFLIPLGDRRSFEKRLVELIDSPVLRKQMGRHNSRLVKRFYISTCAEKYVSLFQNVIANRCMPSGSSVRRASQ
ncbi:MAG: glycosyltransferase [Proteobacteria bacterium]|nr:glycosyltransferase [Pseudomonadota bacterium]